MSSSTSLDFYVGGLVGFTITVLAVAMLALSLRFWSRLVSPGVSLRYRNPPEILKA